MKNEVWVVAMDLTKMDSRVLAYTQFLNSQLNPKKIHFVHIMEEFKSSSYLPSEFLELGNQLVVDKELKIQHKIGKYFLGSGLSYECHVLPGSPFEEIIDFVVSHSATLVIAGRKKVSSGSGVVSERLSRNLPCDFLLLTEDRKPKLKKVLVATDFSKHSTLAMHRALKIKEQVEDLKIVAHHSYRVPDDYKKSGKSYEEFAGILEESAKKEMTRWLTRFKQKIKPVLTSKKDTSLADQIVKTATKKNIDLILIGSKGQSMSLLALMGSNTMKLIRANEIIPIYIAKSKNENLKLLDVLRKG